MSRRARLGFWAAAGGALAAGLATGVAGERTVVRAQRRQPDPLARTGFGPLPATRQSTVPADDGVALHVEEVGDLDAPLTIIFSHGYTLEMACWWFQRLALGDLGRLVFWDQRAHGRSGASPAEQDTIDQLGSDLLRVLEATAPTGDVVLVGHSMGGMTVMAVADQRPDLFGETGRVCGVALIGTSAGQLASVTFGLPRLAGALVAKVYPRATAMMGRRASLVDRRRTAGMGSDVSYALTRRLSFGPGAPPSLVDFMERMIAATPAQVISDFASTFLSHDKLAALDALTGVEVLVLCGDQDALTPVEHSRAIAAALPAAELVVLPGAGHMVMLERPALVDLHLRALVTRARERVAART